MKEGRGSNLLVFFMVALALGYLAGPLVSPSTYSTANSALGQSDGASDSRALGQYAANPSSTPILYLSNLTTLRSTAEHVAESANASTIQSITSHLSSFDNRYTGTQGSLSAISYIQHFFTTNCSLQKVYLDNFTFNDGGVLIQASNIIARIDASNLTSKTLLVTAHHDSIGYQYPFNVYGAGAKGADDDASGVGAVLEAARVLSMFKQYLAYNVLFIIFASEEGNKTLDSVFTRQGSINWISSNHMGVDSLIDIVGVVNLDEVAYKYGGSIGAFYHSSGKNVALNVTSAATMLSIDVQDEGHARTDSYLKAVRCRTEDTFDDVTVPAVTLSTHYANPFTHTTQDTLSNLDFELACNFTKTVLSYVYLTCGLTPEPAETYSADWCSVICSNAKYTLNETNYIDVLIRPSIVTGYQLVILDPSLGEMNAENLLSIASACRTGDKRLPILSLSKTGIELLGALTHDDIEYIEQNASNGNLVAYLESSITGISHHPVFNSPNKITLTRENDTFLSYAIKSSQLSDHGSFCYLVRETSQLSPFFLELGYTPCDSRLWTWLGILHTHNCSCGPIAFIGMENGSALPDAAKGIVENTVYWLLNGLRTVITVEPSECNPLVGDHVKINVCLRSSLTWKANSSVPLTMTLISPSGNQLLREMHMTDQNGTAESSTVFLTEIGQYKVNATILAGGGTGTSRTTTSFNSGPRINVSFTPHEISVVQGESTNIELDLTYIPITPGNVTLTLGGSALSSNVTVAISLSHGYRNVSLAITAREAVPSGEYNLTLTIMPSTREYVACEQFIRTVVTPGYDVSIVEAPKAIVQGSRSEALVQVTSHRSIAVYYTLRIESSLIILKGGVSSTISAGATQQISLPVEEASDSPYCWGEGQIQIVLIRNGFPNAKSQPLPISVDLNSMNLFLGYILPPTLLLTIAVDRLRRATIRRVVLGAVLGGSISFACGLFISQSIFMLIPLALLVAGSYSGAAAVKYIYDKPLPKGYDWLIPSPATGDNQKNHRVDHKRD